MKRIHNFVLLALIMVPLASCGKSGPSKTDIQTMLNKEIQQSNAQMQVLAESNPYISAMSQGLQAKSIEVLQSNCTSEPNSEYSCAITVLAEGQPEQNSRTVNATLIKSPDGWTVVGH